MQRLLRDAQKLTGKRYNLNNLADIYEAIHAIQTELDITGTTAKEASTTIQGSIGQMKAAWQNLKIAIADPNGNVGEAISNLVDSAKTAATNIVPVVGTALKGISGAIRELAPVISAELPGLVSDVLPDLVSGAVALIGGLTQALVDNAPMIFDAIGQIFQEIGNILKNTDNPILQAVGELIGFIGDLIRDPEGTLTAAWETVWNGISETASTIWEAFKTFATTAWNSIKQAISTVWEALKSTASTVWESIKTTITTIWDSVKSTATTVWGSIKTSITSVWDGIKSAASTTWEAIKTTITGIWDGIKSTASTVWESIKTTITAVWEGIKTTASTVWESIKTAVTAPIEAVKTTLSTIWDSIKTTATTAWNAVKDAITPVIDGIKSVIDGVINTVKDVINWFKKLMGYNGDTLSETKSSHTHTNTTINKVVTYTETVEGANGGTIEVTGYDDGSNTAIHRDANGNQTGVSGGRGFAKGNWFVPYDMPALLHRNEMVLTASQARRFRDGEGGMDYARIGAMIAASVERAIRNVNVYLGADRVGALTSGYVDQNIKANDHAILRGMGG